MSSLRNTPSGALLRGLSYAALATIAILSFTTATGCKKSRSGSSAASLCERDPELLAMNHACGRDDDCPCGAHCDLGQCVHECLGDRECTEGNVCDTFGRCLPPERAGLPVEVASGARGVLFVDRDLVELLDPSSTQTFRVAARMRDIDVVRIAAPENVEVACGADGSFGRDCLIEPIGADQPGIAVRVRRTEGTWPEADERHAVLVHARGQRAVVGVRVRGTPPPEPPTRVGVYEGYAQLVGAGLRARTVQDALPEELSRLRLPIRVHVFPESGAEYPVRFFDARQAVFADASSGALRLDAQRRWNLTVDRRRYLAPSPDSPGAANLDLDVHVAGAMNNAVFRDGILEGDYVATFEGVTPVDQAPFARFRVQLVRVGNLPSNAQPPSPTSSTTPNVSSRANAALAEETAGLEALAQIPGLTAPAERAIAALCSLSENALVSDLSSTTFAYGDLLCGDGARPRAFGVEEGRLESRGTFVTSCVEELRGEAQLVLGDASQADVCLDRVRAITALGAALDTDRRRGLGESLTADLPTSRLALRLLQQWISVQGFAALEPRRVHRIAPLLPEGPGLAALRAYADRNAVFESMQTSIAGWDLLLHPRIGTGLAAMAPAALRAPDYRPSLGNVSPTGGEAKLGLPVSILYALKDQLEGIEGLLEDLRYFRAPPEESAALSDELARFLPRSIVVFAMAQGLYDAARSEATPDWQSAWEAARITYGTALSQMLRSLEFLESGVNPLGIDPYDLPLYRLGDQEGVSTRFTALSDTLLGREDRVEPSIAPVLLEQAADALEMARASIASILDRDLTDAFESADADRRLEAIRRRYGEEVASICGNPDFDSLTVLDQADQIDANSCFLRASCGFGVEEYEERLSLADIGYEICIAAKLRERFGSAVTSGQAEIDRQLDNVSGRFGPDTPFFSAGFGQALISGFSAAYNGTSRSSMRLPGGIDANVVREVQALCESGRQATLSERPVRVPSSCQSTDDCPVDYVCNTAVSVCEPDAEITDPSCFWGSLGEVAVSMQGAATDLAIARSELEEYTERYDNAMRSCILLQQGNIVIADALEAHNATMNELAAAKLAADIAAHVAQGAKEAFSLSSPFSAIGAVVSIGAEVAAKSTSDTIANRMEMAERAHELTMQRLEAAVEERICFNEAEAELVGSRSAALRIRRQSEELSRHLVEFENLKVSVRALLAEGKAALASEEVRRVSPTHVDYWLDENVSLLDLRMRRARRALYLALVAVEYEFQLTSPERANILAAKSPGELEGILARLREQLRRGAPNGGGNPTELLTVLSLRRNLMQLADRSGFDPAWHNLPEEERFRHLLVAPQHAVYGADGRYLGQEIPFTIQPFGKLNLGDTGAIPLLTGLNCAERLWYVNAIVQGEDVMERTDSSIVTMQVRKRNTFSSQWCDERRTDPEEQTATTRPSRNLFVDPYSAYSWQRDRTLSEFTDTDEVAAFAWATVQARTNIERRDFESESYTDGRSQALAGRGVFGDYTLFIPAASQSIDGSAGLRLGNVTDILIRLDYVAAERR